MIFVLLLILTALRASTAQDFTGKDTVNVRTILFREQDATKQCWALEDVNLLIARKMMQDLLPRKLPTDFDKLARYIKMVMEVVRTKSPPESANRLTLAAYDVLGGYLKTVGIPILNEEYYAGNVPYCTAAEIHCLYGRIMAYLKTDGGGWSGPIDMRRIPTKVRALTITIANTSEACNTLEVRPSPGPAAGAFASKECVRISIPYLDDNSYPNAIAVPLRGNSLFSLMSNCSANLLPKFYILAMRCLASNSFSRQDIICFNHNFYDWIVSSVVPHVHETERWYPGFGGVMRIVETMNQRGLASHDSVRPDTNPSNNGLPALDGMEDTNSWKNKHLLWFGLAIVLGVIFLFCICYCLIKSCSKPPPESEETHEGLAKTLVSIYCGVKNSLVGGKNQQTDCSKDEIKSSSRSNSGMYDQKVCYSSSEECESSAPSSD